MKGTDSLIGRKELSGSKVRVWRCRREAEVLRHHGENLALPCKEGLLKETTGGEFRAYRASIRLL